MQDPNADTEWNDVLRAKGIIPPKVSLVLRLPFCQDWSCCVNSVGKPSFIYPSIPNKVNAAGDLEITEDTLVGLIDQRIAEGKNEKNYEDMTLEEIDALEDDEDERVLQVRLFSSV